jgi:phosphoribosylglycinamide formyltransferase-1
MTNPNQGRGWASRNPEVLSVVVLASGNGSNLQAILDRFKNRDDVEIVGVASNKPNARALQRARAARIPTDVFERRNYEDRLSRDLAMAAWIKSRGAELVVCAGYMEILSPQFVDQFRARIINIHPSRLPKFRGLHAIERAFNERVWRTGVTLHFIDEGVDTGPVIKQRSVWRRRWESFEKFEQRIHAVEHKLLPETISHVAAGKVKIGEERDKSWSLRLLLKGLGTAPGRTPSSGSGTDSGRSSRAEAEALPALTRPR